MNKKSEPIGVFDSGIGGLTVVKEIRQILPDENIIYVGDTARVPYGTREKETITNFALQMVGYLLKQNVKYLVVACNTISATCLDKIKALSPVPVIGVIEPAVQIIIDTTKTKNAGIIGTRATINSNAYEKAVNKINPEIKIISCSCPLFVPLAEENLGDSNIAFLAAKKYFQKFRNTKIDTLHLGCTHYPLLKKIIQKAIGKNITLIDSAKPTAQGLKFELEKYKSINTDANSSLKIYLTDVSEETKNVVELFLGKSTYKSLEKVNLA